MNQKPIDIAIARPIDIDKVHAVAQTVPITPDPEKVKSKLRSQGMMQVQPIDIAIASAIGLDTSTLDLLDNEGYAADCRARIKYERGDKSHLMFRQWAKMICCCTCPWDKRWPLFGGRGITVDSRWLDFRQFVKDMEPTFEFRPDKPATLRHNYLHRRSTRAGFNKANAIWVIKAEVMTIQQRTKTYPTPFGRPEAPPIMMSLTEIHKYMETHANEEWPDGRTYTLHVRELNALERMQTVARIVTTIQPVSMGELRRRVREGRDLFRPVRPYGDKAEAERDMAAEALLEARRELVEATRPQREAERLAKLAAALGAENVRPYDPNAPLPGGDLNLMDDTPIVKPETEPETVPQSVNKFGDNDVEF